MGSKNPETALFEKNPWAVALVVTPERIRAVGLKSPFKDAYTACQGEWDFKIVRNPELNATQLALACALANPELSYYQIAKLLNLTAGAVSKAMKPHLETCPCCKARVRPPKPRVLTPSELKNLTQKGDALKTLRASRLKNDENDLF